MFTIYVYWWSFGHSAADWFKYMHHWCPVGWTTMNANHTIQWRKCGSFCLKFCLRGGSLGEKYSAFFCRCSNFCTPGIQYSVEASILHQSWHLMEKQPGLMVTQAPSPGPFWYDCRTFDWVQPQVLVHVIHGFMWLAEYNFLIYYFHCIFHLKHNFFILEQNLENFLV